MDMRDTVPRSCVPCIIEDKEGGISRFVEDLTPKWQGFLG